FGENAVGAVVRVCDALIFRVGGLDKIGGVVVNKAHYPSVRVVHARLPLDAIVAKSLDVVLRVCDLRELVVEVVVVKRGPGFESASRSAIVVESGDFIHADETPQSILRMNDRSIVAIQGRIVVILIKGPREERFVNRTASSAVGIRILNGAK